MNENVDRRGDLLPDHPERKVSSAQYHRLQATDHIGRTVGMAC